MLIPHGYLLYHTKRVEADIVASFIAYKLYWLGINLIHLVRFNGIVLPNDRYFFCLRAQVSLSNSIYEMKASLILSVVRFAYTL